MYTHSRAAKLNHTPMINTPNIQERPKSTIVLDVEAPSSAGLRDVVCRVQALTELLEVNDTQYGMKSPCRCCSYLPLIFSLHEEYTVL